VTSGATPPFGIDVTVPTTARIYDYWLGGQDNFAADRVAALAITEVAPEARLMAVENRGFLRRAVRFLAAEAGITQFLDIGTGLPTQGNVHQVAQEVNAGARVVYVDNDPMVLAHSRALKTGGSTVVIQADLREPRTILDHASTRKLIDFTQPLAVLLVAVLHFISDDDDPAAIVATIRETLPPGSYLVISHVTGDMRPLPGPPCTTGGSRPERHCGAGRRSCGSSLAWISSTRAWSRCLTGVLTTSPLMPGKCGFSAASAASRISWRQAERDAGMGARARPTRPGANLFPPADRAAAFPRSRSDLGATRSRSVHRAASEPDDPRLAGLFAGALRYRRGLGLSR